MGAPKMLESCCAIRSNIRCEVLFRPTALLRLSADLPRRRACFVARRKGLRHRFIEATTFIRILPVLKRE